MQTNLSPRAARILVALVGEYIHTGEPVGSARLAQSAGLSVSSATVRSTLAELEELGYLQQPHTSAGRVPTDRGYRFFIDYLMRSRILTQREREEIDGEVGHGNEIEEVLHLASRVISRLSDQVGVVFMPTLLQFAIRRRLIRMTEEDRAQHDRLLQKTIALGIDAVNDVAPLEHELVMEGAASILTKPEFADAASMRKTFLALQEKEKLVEILNACLSEEGLQILIGSESNFTQIYNFSIVARRYGTQAAPLGMVGIIGPMRMEYARMAPLVDYLGVALSRKIEEEQEQ